MSRRNKGGYATRGKNIDQYWNTADYNQRMFFTFRNQIISLAMARFKWNNLPATCDERFLERTLLYEGLATISHPRRGVWKKSLLNTSVAQANRPNIYLRPTSWVSYGQNGTNFRADWKTGVLIYDNMTWYPIMEQIDIYARELVDIMRTKQINRMHQKTPYIITGPQEKSNDMINLYKQIAGFEPAVIATSDINAIEINALNTNVAFLGEELHADLQNVWNQIYQFLGIQNLPFKAERQIEDEVKSQSEPNDLMALSSLQQRREAAEKLNRKFYYTTKPENKLLAAPISVVWRQDNESDNYNYSHNIQDRKDETNDTEL